MRTAGSCLPGTIGEGGIDGYRDQTGVSQRNVLLFFAAHIDQSAHLAHVLVMGSLAVIKRLGFDVDLVGVRSSEHCMTYWSNEQRKRINQRVRSLEKPTGSDFSGQGIQQLSREKVP